LDIDVSFPDNPELLSTPKDFARRVLADATDIDISAELSKLLGFARNFYLQFFDFCFGITIARIDREARRAVRPTEKKLRAAGDGKATLRLISHFVTLVEFLEDDDIDLYDEFELGDRRRRVLDDAQELVNRIAEWASDVELPVLAAEAADVHADFELAVERVELLA